MGLNSTEPEALSPTDKEQLELLSRHTQNCTRGTKPRRYSHSVLSSFFFRRVSPERLNLIADLQVNHSLHL